MKLAVHLTYTLISILTLFSVKQEQYGMAVFLVMEAVFLLVIYAKEQK